MQLLFNFFFFFFVFFSIPCGLQDLSSLPRIEPWTMAVKAPSLNHGTVVEFPTSFFFLTLIFIQL